MYANLGDSFDDDLEDDLRERLTFSKPTKPSKPSKLSKKLVKLNVGGLEFTTTVQTLKSHSCSFFDALLSGKWELEETIFIDRDGSMFKHVLNFLRGESLQVDLFNQQQLARLRLDADFYMLSDLASLVAPPPREIFSTVHRSDNIINIEDDTVARGATGYNQYEGVLGAVEYDRGVHTFRFSIQKLATSIFFGVGRESSDNYYFSIDPQRNSNSYGWAGSKQVYMDGSRSTCTETNNYNTRAGDTIRLTLDCTRNVLKFKNETNDSTTFSLDLPAGLKWRFQVALVTGGDKIKWLGDKKI